MSDPGNIGKRFYTFEQPSSTKVTNLASGFTLFDNSIVSPQLKETFVGFFDSDATVSMSASVSFS